MPSDDHNSTNAQALLAALFVGDSPDVPADFMTQVGQDAKARTTFNQLALVDAALSGSDDASFDTRSGELAFLSALDAQLTAEGGVPETADDLPDNVVAFPRRRTFMGAAALAAAAVLAATWINLQPEDPFQARSAVTPQSTYQKPQLLPFCVERGPDGPTFWSADDAEFGVLKCSKDDELKLAYTNTDARLKHAAFFGATPDGELFWYGPSPAATAPLAIAVTGDAPQPVGESIRLGVNHQAGPVRVYGVFTPKPLPFDELERWTKSQKLYESPQLETEGVIVSATLDITEGKP